MSTVYSNEVAIGTYNRIRIKCDYSGTSATLTIQFRRTSSRYDTWRDTAARLIFNGQDKDANYAYTGTVGTNWVDLRPAISGYTISSSGGTYSWQFTQPAGGVLGCSGTLTIPAQGSKPSNGYINDLSSEYLNGVLSVKAGEVGVADGGLSLTSTKFNLCRIPFVTSPPTPSQDITFTNGGSVTINQNNSAPNYGGISIEFNSLYYTGIWAANSAGNYAYTGPSVITVPAPASFYKSKVSGNSVVVGYSSKSGNMDGYQTEELQYSFDGTNWTTAVTVDTNEDYSGEFTISNLAYDTIIIIYFRTTTPAGSTSSGQISFRTDPYKTTKMYGPGPVANMITSITGVIRSGGIGNLLSFDEDKFYKTFFPRLSPNNLSYIKIQFPGPNNNYRVTLHYTDAAEYTVNIARTLMENYGFDVKIQNPNPSSGNDYVDTTVTVGPGFTTGRFFKFYGPVNGDAKSIVKFYGSVDGRAKLIYKEKY